MIAQNIMILEVYQISSHQNNSMNVSFLFLAYDMRVFDKKANENKTKKMQ